MYPIMKTIIAMPAYNEANYIGSVVLQAKQYGDEVIVADDGSKDRTADIAELAGASVIRHATNLGKGAGVRDIIAEAAKRNADVLVLMDADAQHDPREIPGLIKAVKEGGDLVIGSRSIGRENIPSYRKVGQKVLSKLTGTLSKAKVMDTESGFRAFSRKAINTMHLKENGFAIEAEMISEAADQGLNIVEVPITAIYTQDGSTLNPITHGVGNVNRILVLISERKPVFYFGMLGGLLILLGIIAGIVVFKTYKASSNLAMGTALICMLLITVGTLLVSTGIILGVLVKRLGNPR
jgi:glycosyltransferase involved in cell wall biosynthesis